MMLDIRLNINSKSAADEAENGRLGINGHSSTETAI
jgi:hypothetical protein